MLFIALTSIAVAASPVVYSPDVQVTASSHSGAKYAPAKAVDGNGGTRWASADLAPLPQWLEVRLEKASVVDTVILQIAVDNLYCDWKDIELTFSQGKPVQKSLRPGQTLAVLRFPALEVEWVRATVHSVHNRRHYVGLYEITVAHDPDATLAASIAATACLAQSEIVARGRTDHPCVNVTPGDVHKALERIEKCGWAKKERDRIIAQADRWLRESDDYWLQFLPEPGACYAYGRTGCPICGGAFGTWHGAKCSWDKPRQVTCSGGHVLPDDAHPDDATGYEAPDGRVHYFIGVWNAWVTEQWTQHALPALSQAYLLTRDERYADRGTLLLDAMASVYPESTSGSWDYPSDPPSGRLCRPWYQVARTLVLYTDQYDFMYASTAMEKPSLRQAEEGQEPLTRRENIEHNLLLNGAYYCYRHSFSGALHNGHADYMRGALAVGCALDVPVYVDNSINSPFSIHTMLANNIDRDGRYYETSLGYALHARNLYVTFADPLYNLRNEEYPNGINLYDDPKFQACILLPDIQATLAGRMPNFGDCAPDTAYRPARRHPFSRLDYRFLERLYARVSDPKKRQGLGRALLWLAQGDLDALRGGTQYRNWLMWHAGEVTAQEATLTPELAHRVHDSWIAGMKGIAFMRGDNQAALLRFGPSLNHGDPDDLGLNYYANGYELSYDIGYGFGSAHVHVGWASQTISHCLVTVDETSQYRGDIPTSGGSLHYFADLPSVKAVEAESARSYASLDVEEYRRTVALVTGGHYLFDVFRVRGGHQHDYAWGSLGTDLEPFGVAPLEAHEGSLAEGVAWGQRILAEGDIEGYPNKPYWNPPPGNGYGFFYNIRRGRPSQAEWGGTWDIAGTVPTRFRAHLVGDDAEAIYASAPGLYPSKPNAGYILARRTGENGDGQSPFSPLMSTFLAVYEPFSTNMLAYDFDHTYLARHVVATSVEPEVKDGLGVVYLRGKKTGDYMTFRLEHAEDLPGFLNIHTYKSYLYATVQVEWDGQSVGEPINLNQDAVSGPHQTPIGQVDATAGEHTLALRICEGKGLHVGLAGLTFGNSADDNPKPVIDAVRRVGTEGVEVRRTDGSVDVLLAGSCDADSAYGRVTFDGDFAFLTGNGTTLQRAEVTGCRRLEVAGTTIDPGPDAFQATVIEVDLERRAVTLDQAVPDGLENRVAVFSNPKYALTTAYHVAGAEGHRLRLVASSLAVGKGRVATLLEDRGLILSDIPHMYLGAHGTGFVNGKCIRGHHGGETRVIRTEPSRPLRVYVEDTSALHLGETFEYIDLSPGDHVRIALQRVQEARVVPALFRVMDRPQGE